MFTEIYKIYDKRAISYVIYNQNIKIHKKTRIRK